MSLGFVRGDAFAGRIRPESEDNLLESDEDGTETVFFTLSIILEVNCMGNVASIQELKKAILDFDDVSAAAAAGKVVKAGASPLDAVNAMGDALRELGVKFQAMEVFLPEVLLATDAFKAALKVLEPELAKTVAAGSAEKKIKVIIGTVKGDVHAVGKDMVATMMTVGGFDVKDVGADVDSEFFITAAEDFGADIIGLSALMSTTMPAQREVIEFLKAKGLRDKYIVMVGGGPCTPEWADKIGADGFSKDAVEAVAVANKLVAKKKK